MSKTTNNEAAKNGQQPQTSKTLSSFFTEGVKGDIIIGAALGLLLLIFPQAAHWLGYFLGFVLISLAAFAVIRIVGRLLSKAMNGR